MSVVKVSKKVKWYDQRLVAFGLALLSFFLAWRAGLHALDTARNLAYVAFFVLIILGLNRLVKGIRG